MRNINELETRWLHYKIKSYIPHMFIVLIAISILLFISFTPTESTKKTVNIAKQIVKPTVLKQIKKPTVIKKDVVIKKKTVVKKPTIKKQIQVTKQIKSKMVIVPSLNFIRTIQGDSPQYYNSEKFIPIKEHKQIIAEKEIVEDEALEVPIQKVEIVQENRINITRQNTQKDIEHVIARFKKSNNPALSLFVAKKYYELGRYNQAYNYALMTNEINQEIEDSWIIFGKSLYKLGKKDKAISILQKYIKQSHSHKAKIILDNIKSGKLK